MNRFLMRLFASAVCLTLALAALAEDRKAPKPPPPPPPPTLEQTAADLTALEGLVALWEKQLAGSTDAKQRASAHQALVLKAGQIANQLAALGQLLEIAKNATSPKDATGGLDAAARAEQTRRKNDLNELDGRLKAVKERIAALEKPAGDKDGGKAAPGPAPGKPVVTPSAGDKEK